MKQDVQSGNSIDFLIIKSVYYITTIQIRVPLVSMENSSFKNTTLVLSLKSTYSKISFIGWLEECVHSSTI